MKINLFFNFDPTLNTVNDVIAKDTISVVKTVLKDTNRLQRQLPQDVNERKNFAVPHFKAK